MASEGITRPSHRFAAESAWRKVAAFGGVHPTGKSEVVDCSSPSLKPGQQTRSCIGSDLELDRSSGLDEERPRAIRAETDQGRRVELWATYLAEIMERVSPLMGIVRSGSEAEPEMRELYRTLHQGRRANLGLMTQSILRSGELRDGLSVDEATDVLWQLASPEMFNLLTDVGGYSTQRYAAWLATMLKAAMLPRP